MTVSVGQIERDGNLDGPGVQRALRKLARLFPLGGQHIQDGAITPAKRAAAVAANDTRTTNTTLTTSYQTILDVTIDSTGRPLVAAYHLVYSNANSGQNRSISLRTTLDGSTVGQDRSLHAPWVSGINTPLTAAGVHLLTPAAGSRTVALLALAGATSSVVVSAGELVVYEL